MTSKLRNFIKAVKTEAVTMIKGKPPQECNATKPQMNLDEYDNQEMNRTKDDTTDKVKPYDNLETKIYHPELREQFEKRKDTFHTLDTPYIKEKCDTEKNNLDQNKKV